ncbi:MAG: phosphatase PAP2 family protein [Firmicutes bacterium]|nr:phosphatase PAP2 family protein [Bacillota bacterium]
MENQTDKSKNIAVILCGYALFALISWAMISSASAGFDDAVRDFILGLRTPALNAFFIPFAYSGNWFVVVPICLVLLIIPRTRWAYGIPASASVVTAQLFYQVLKRVFRRERPDWALHLVKEHGFSYPSGHAITSCMLFAMLAVLILYYHHRKGLTLPVYRNTPRPTKAYFRSRGAAYFCAWLCFLYILLMGFARVYVGVHWPTDVLASWCLAAANLTWLTRIFIKR